MCTPGENHPREKKQKQKNEHLPEYWLFRAAEEGCLQCVQHFLQEVDGPYTGSENQGWTVLAWASWGLTKGQKGAQEVVNYLRATYPTLPFQQPNTWKAPSKESGCIMAGETSSPHSESPDMFSTPSGLGWKLVLTRKPPPPPPLPPSPMDVHFPRAAVKSRREPRYRAGEALRLVQAYTCTEGMSHKPIKNRQLDAKYFLFQAIRDGCFPCVEDFLTKGQVDITSETDNMQYTVLDFARFSDKPGAKRLLAYLEAKYSAHMQQEASEGGELWNCVD